MNHFPLEYLDMKMMLQKERDLLIIDLLIHGMSIFLIVGTKMQMKDPNDEIPSDR